MSAKDNSPRLSINVDHVATVRQARRAPYPDPVDAARIAEDSGADGITVHLREDRRHIQDDDVARLREMVNGKLNLEIAATEAMVRIAQNVGPHQVTLVPERADEITTEGGLDLGQHQSRIQRVASTLAQSGIEVSLFLDPRIEQLGHLEGMSDVTGFEINTDTYTRQAWVDLTSPAADAEIEAIERMTRAGREAGLEVYAGHGMTVRNVGRVAAIPDIEEFNIGHSIVARAVLVGMAEAVREMKAAMAAAGGSKA